MYTVLCNFEIFAETLFQYMSRAQSYVNRFYIKITLKLTSKGGGGGRKLKGAKLINIVGEN